MKKIVIISSILLFFAAFPSISQTRRHFEFEPFLSMDFPIYNADGKEMPHPGFGFETRYNFSNIPLDLGLEVSLSVADRDFMIDSEKRQTALRNATFALYGDYSFNIGNKFTPFIGAGFGYAQMRSMKNYNPWTTPHHGITFIPRFGVEIFNHLRLTVDCRILNKYYNTVGLKIGYSFGRGIK